MSRLGKKPLPIPEKVKVEFKNNTLEATGPLGKMSQPIHPRITIKVDKSQLLVEPLGSSREDNMLHGLTRGLVKNALDGVSLGFKKNLEVQGLGYKVALEGNKLTMQLGFSHPVVFPVPEGIKVVVDKQTLISISGVDKALVGEVAARIRALRPPEPYKGTGVRYAGEHIIRKVGKTAAGSSGGGAGGGKK
jgi:large subunit ribosomal protein L6